MKVYKYKIPDSFVKYHQDEVDKSLRETNKILSALKQIYNLYPPNLKKDFQSQKFKRELSSTSRIEGAEFTEEELDNIFNQPNTSAEEGETRSQKELINLKKTYEWLVDIPEKLLTEDLIFETHKKIIKGIGGSEIGKVRTSNNVTFGMPAHRGAEGGKECQQAFKKLFKSYNEEMQKLDPLIQAFVFHYHFVAIHPFTDGNGRTARAIEFFLLKKSMPNPSFFISQSNYYFDKKDDYFTTLHTTKKNNYNLTDFIIFCLEGVITQCQSLIDEMSLQIKNSIFQNTIHIFFKKLKEQTQDTKDRQLKIANTLLKESLTREELEKSLLHVYAKLNTPKKTLFRDIARLMDLKFIKMRADKFCINYDWLAED